MGPIYAAFIRDTVGTEELFELTLAADYMRIDPLVDLSCAQIAILVRGKSPQEIRETLNIVTDFVPVDEVQLREDNRWAEED